MGFTPGRCVEETEHAHPVTLKRQGRVCTLILNGELYNAKELGRELKADTEIVSACLYAVRTGICAKNKWRFRCGDLG